MRPDHMPDRSSRFLCYQSLLVLECTVLSDSHSASSQKATWIRSLCLPDGPSTAARNTWHFSLLFLPIANLSICRCFPRPPLFRPLHHVPQDCEWKDHDHQYYRPHFSLPIFISCIVQIFILYNIWAISPIVTPLDFPLEITRRSSESLFYDSFFSQSKTTPFLPRYCCIMLLRGAHR